MAVREIRSSLVRASRTRRRIFRARARILPALIDERFTKTHEKYTPYDPKIRICQRAFFEVVVGVSGDEITDRILLTMSTS